MSVIDSIQISGVTYTIQGSGGGGKAIEGGRGISVTTGETADTVSFNLPISAGTGSNSVVEGSGTRAKGSDSHAEGTNTTASGTSSHAEGNNAKANSLCSHAEGYSTTARGSYSHAEGYYTKTENSYEHASGQYNVSNWVTNTFGDSGNTLFSVGNGTSNSARHNAFEIRQNGDIYITSGGTDIKLQDNLGGGGGNPTVELTQAQYDALVTAGTVSADTYYIITDAQAGDLTNYYTKTETNTLLGGKADTATTYTKTEVDNAITAATSTKQDTLVSGTNIKTINNTSILGSGNIDIQGGGGGKAVSGGTNISVTTGTTADTINCTLPITAGTHSTNKGIIVGDNECSASGKYSISIGHNSDAGGNYSFCNGSNSSANGQMSFAYGSGCDANHYNTFMIGNNNKSTKNLQFSFGSYVKPKNSLEFGFGTYNNSVSASTTFGDGGNTLFSIGNGYDFSSTHNWHNAFEVRQNGDIYIANTNDTSVTGDTAYSLYPMIKLQDHLGGGSITVDDMLSSTSTNPVQNKVVKSATDRICNLFGYGTSGQTDMLAWATGATSNVIDNYVQFSKINGKKIIGDRLSPTEDFSLVETSAITTSVTSSSTDAQVPSAKAVNDKLGGLSVVKLTESEYTALVTKDSNTLYVVVPDPSN